MIPTAVFAQISNQRLEQICGAGDLNPVCGAVLRVTNNQFLAAAAGEVVPGALKIVLILLVAFVVRRLLRRVIKRFTRSLTTQAVERFGKISSRVPLADTSPMDISRAAMRTETLGAVLNSVGGFAIWIIAGAMILGVFRINLGPLVAGAGIAGIALGFGAQNVVKDILAGLFVILEDQYGIGDVVDLRDSLGSPGTSGTVESISLRTTRLRDIEGAVWNVPNGEIRTAGNKSQQWARSLIDVNVSYGTDVKHAVEIIKRTADEVWADEEFNAFVLEEPEVWGVERFDADSLAIRLVIKVQPAKQWAVNRELRQRLKAAFDTEGIEIPFQQRTVWLRTAPDVKTGGGAS